MANSGNGTTVLRHLVRFLFLLLTCALIAWAGGGWSFVRKPIPIFYLGVWTAWGVVLSFLRQRGVRSAWDRGQARYLALFGLTVYPAILVGGPWEYGHWTGPLPRDGVAAWVGVALCLAGLVLQTAALLDLRGMYTFRLGIQPGHRLVTTGAYRYVRHPGYASSLLYLVGAALAMSSFIALAAALLLGPPAIIWRIGREEKMLAREFGDTYRQYQHRTRRLVPFIY